jgi:hypothetical protein
MYLFGSKRNLEQHEQQADWGHWNGKRDLLMNCVFALHVEKTKEL